MASVSDLKVDTKPVEMPVKPMLLPLQPIADGLLDPIIALVENFYESLKEMYTTSIISSGVLKTTIPAVLENSPLSLDGAKGYQKIVLEVVILQVLSSFIEDTYKEEIKDYEKLCVKTFILLDISIYLTAISHDSDIDLPFLVIHNIILKNDKTFILDHFQKHFFATISEERRDYLIYHCGVTSATKRPGTEIIDIYNDVTKLFDLTKDKNLEIITNFRLFIAECFNIDEMAVNNPTYKINHHFDAEKNVYLTLKRSRATPFSLFVKVRYQLTYPETMFKERWVPRDCMNSMFDLMKAIFDENLKSVDKKSSGKSGFEIPEKIENRFEIEQLKSIARDFDFSPSFSMTEESFNTSFKEKIFREYLILQIFMMVNHALNYWDSPAFHKSIPIRSELRKTKDFCLSIKKAIQTHYKSTDEQFFYTINTISHDSNRVWVEWKAANFKVVKDTTIDEKRISTAKEVILKNSKIRPKHIPALGTNEISRIWKLETGLKNLSQRASMNNGKFLKLKEDLKKLENVVAAIEEDSDMFTASEIAELKGKREMLTFKALRLYREQGNWLSFSNTNYKLGVEGLFDPSLKVKFDEEQARIEKENFEKEKEIKDDEGDVVMSAEAKTETKIAVEDDLDY